MSEPRNAGEETLQEREARLRRELEELNLAERARDLERQLDAARRRAQLSPEVGQDDLPPTRDSHGQTSAQVSISPEPNPLEHIGNPTCETAQQTHYNQATFPTPINSEPGRDGDPTGIHHAQDSTQMDPSPNLALAKVVRPLGSHDIVQRQSSASAGVSGASTSVRSLPASGSPGPGIDLVATTLQYYQELDVPTDAELSIFDMDLEQLYEFAGALEENPANDAGQVKLLSSVYYFIFSKTGAVDDIQKAIHRAEEAVTATHIDEADYAPRLRNLIVMLMKKHERTRSLEDFDEAILHAEVMLTITQGLHPDRPHRWMDLIKMKVKRSLQTRSWEDLDEAMFMATEAMDGAKEAGVDQAHRHWDRFKETGDLNDLQMAIARGEEAVVATPHDHPDRAGRLSNLAAFLRTRFELTGDLSDLQIAIARGEEVVVAIPYNYPDRARMLSNLAVSLLTRFERTGNVNDLQMAIARGEEAVAAIPHDHPYRAGRLSNLANSLLTRFERTGDFSDLRMAIVRGEEAVAATPHDHPDRAGRLSNLAAFLRTRFERTGDLNDLEIAITRGEEAVAATPHDHPDRAAMLNNLANSLSTRFERMDDLNDLQMAIVRGEEAVAAIPHDHPDRAAMLSNLAALLRTRFNRTGNPDDSERAVHLWVAAAELDNAPPRIRITSALRAAEILANNSSGLK
ncbi:hypothetical protein EDB81DRAFT_215218 [Dactylonectria macrodidyma]|uniref:Uncharacterized protein n=1 Tax=Dactylonectria macrodidyma TaxID=307937 RepID=A0A9P9DS68_9HYPO|nr:hypothetical protein EDB81DRAFT_215218 [Dactylonectria macrodidyma]